MKISLHFKPLLFSLGALLCTISVGIIEFMPGLDFLFKCICIVLFFFGAFLSVLGIIDIKYRIIKYTDKWNTARLERSLLKAKDDSEIKIMNTFFAESIRFVHYLEDLLCNKGKAFKLRVMLLDYVHAQDIIEARVLLRRETKEQVFMYIKEQVREFILLKENVDKTWQANRSGASLNLEIRLYRFLPAGPFYQIGCEKQFVGFNLANKSAISGPMIEVVENNSNIWNSFEEAFEQGWQSSRKVYPQNTQIDEDQV